MKDRILNTIHEKLCKGFNTKFLSSTQFEKEFSEQYNSILESLILNSQTYLKLKNEYSPEVLKITKEDFIIEQFNDRKYGYGNDYKIEDLWQLKQRCEHDYERYADLYENKIKNEDEKILTVFFEYMLHKKREYFVLEDSNSGLSIQYLFWNFFRKTNYENSYHKRFNINEIIESPEKIIEEFKKGYLSNIYLKLLDVAEKNIADENLSGFETYMVNIGNRSFELERSGWIKNTFRILNNGTEYNFSYSSKDENYISGECINIFIFQNKYLIKFSITLQEVERTPYIIHRDCEKVSLRNECEVLIVKHHGNENIVFDTRKEALEFQKKLIEIREGRKLYDKTR